MTNMAHLLFLLENAVRGPAWARAQPRCPLCEGFQMDAKVKAPRHPCNFIQVHIRHCSYSLRVWQGLLKPSPWDKMILRSDVPIFLSTESPYSVSHVTWVK